METSQEVETTYFLSYPERLRAALDITLSSPATLLGLSFFPIIGTGLLWTMSLPTSQNTIWDYLIAMGCFAFVPLMFLWNTYRIHRANRGKGPYRYRFDHDGIHVTTPTSELTHRWPAISRVRQRRGILFLYFSKRCAHCVPVRALSMPEAATAIQKLAAAAGVPRVGT